MAMNKQKLFSILSFLGVIFFLVLIIGYIHVLNTRGELILDKVEVDGEFVEEFSRVITKNRANSMPEIEFLDPEGKSQTWKDFEGNYLLVNFWATWCPPCIVELPSMGRLQKSFKGRGLEVIAVSVDTLKTQEQIKDFLYSRDIGEFAAYWDAKDEVEKNVPMRGIPTTYLLDPEGNILHIFEGDANWASPAAYAFFKELLNQPK